MNQNANPLKQPQTAEAIQLLLDSGCAFALFRQPGRQEVELVVQTTGNVMEVQPDDHVLTGFVFAPFHTTKHRPTLLIRPDRTATGWTDIIAGTTQLPKYKLKLNQLDHFRAEWYNVDSSRFYDERFRDTIKQISEERFEKLVLTYCEQNCGEYHIKGKEARVFLRALDAYPNAMVYLCYTPQGGRWIGCTPETLVDREGDRWHTISLAGTCTEDDGEWNTKNIHEQDVVTRYICQELRALGAEETHSRFTTMRIGQLLHIRTDFDFQFHVPTHTLDIMRALHPTPAVCGFPKKEAYQYLRQCEKACRNYFSGYLGPINGDEEAHIYVNLRCAQITRNDTYYHAGGGITPLSLLWEERQEIQRKMRILKDHVKP